MKITISTALMFLMLNAGLAFANDPGSPFKGHVQLNRTMHERIIRPDASYDFGAYLGSDYQLLQLLGTYQSNGLNQEFINGVPNVLNVVLYHLALSGLADDIASLCDPASATAPLASAVNDDFLAALKPLCAWPASIAKSDGALLGFYLSMMSYDAPEDDFQEWKTYFQGSDVALLSQKQAITAMSLTLLMNPYFLLQE